MSNKTALSQALTSNLFSLCLSGGVGGRHLYLLTLCVHLDPGPLALYFFSHLELFCWSVSPG